MYEIDCGVVFGNVKLVLGDEVNPLEHIAPNESDTRFTEFFQKLSGQTPVVWEFFLERLLFLLNGFLPSRPFARGEWSLVVYGCVRCHVGDEISTR